MKHLVLSFARCQGISKGHEKVFDIVAQLCEDYTCQGFIYLSKTVDNNKNPLTYEYRMDMCKQMFPAISDMFIDDLSVRTIFDMVRKHSDKDATLHIVCGGDRVYEYQYKFDKYNNTDYNFKKIVVHNAGERTDGVSGTYLRQLAQSGHLVKFLENMPSTATTISSFDLFCELRSILKLGNMPNENTKDFISRSSNPD